MPGVYDSVISCEALREGYFGIQSLKELRCGRRTYADRRSPIHQRRDENGCVVPGWKMGLTPGHPANREDQQYETA